MILALLNISSDRNRYAAQIFERLLLRSIAFDASEVDGIK